MGSTILFYVILKLFCSIAVSPVTIKTHVPVLLSTAAPIVTVAIGAPDKFTFTLRYIVGNLTVFPVIKRLHIG